MSVFSRSCGWLTGGLGALAVLVGLALFPPRLVVDHGARYLATEADSRGFFGPETDGTGNRLVWTEPRATTAFAYAGPQPLTLHLVLRSAAVAGGPDAPTRVIANG